MNNNNTSPHSSVLLTCCCLFLFLLASSLPLSHATSHAFLHHHHSSSSSSSALPTTILLYHNGPLLSTPDPINLYLLWYGSFSPSQISILTDFFSSFSPPSPPHASSSSSSSTPSVSSWWKTTTLYTDNTHLGITNSILLKSQSSDLYSLGKRLLKSHIATLVDHALSTAAFPVDPRGIYFVLTSDDVYVDDFCMNTCGFHDHSPASTATNNQRLVYAWVGNSAKQCPGQCAWPFAAPQFGPPTVLVAPNTDVGMDGMIINIATILAGAATNPFDDGYFQGDARAPEEAVSACTGIFGNGAFPGFPGDLLVDKTTGASYNAQGANNRLFLLPGMWDPSTKSCTTLS